MDYILLLEREKTEKQIFDRLGATKRTPLLLCLLDDLRRDIQLYEEVWTVSGERYARHALERRLLL
jgi:hypothetical protein